MSKVVPFWGHGQDLIRRSPVPTARISPIRNANVHMLGFDFGDQRRLKRVA